MEKIADMMSEDKTEFPERTKETVIRKQGVPWKFMEKKILENTESAFDDRNSSKCIRIFALTLYMPERNLQIGKRSWWKIYSG